MKAERRHELQQNTLAKVLEDLPLYLRFHANKILVGVIVVCLLFLLYRHRTNSAEQSRELAKESLTNARMGMMQLKQVDQMNANDLARASERKKLIDQVQLAIDQILSSTSDSSDAPLRAEASVLRGDLLWEVANLPPLPGASTLPAAVAPPTTRESLDSAEAAYRETLVKYPNQSIPRVASLLALAAIEENRGNWEKALEQYKIVEDDTTIPQLYRSVAKARQEVIPTIRNRTFLGKFSSTAPATAPSTAPAIETAASMPATAPTTNPQ